MVDWRNPPRLFIPGPVHVLPEVLQEMSRYTLGHRSKEYSQLQGEVIPKLKDILFTKQHVFFSTSSASGIWEASVRNLVKDDEKVLNVCCGAFSDKWHDVTKACGKDADAIMVEWGKPTTVDIIDEALSKGDYAVVTVVHNETSTGVTNPLKEIGLFLKEKYPNVLLCVDAVSGMVGLPLKIDEWNIDVAFASVQKAFAIPPGFAVFTVSERAMEKSAQVEGRGYYFDFQQFKKSGAKDQTPTTPSIPHIYALNYQCDKLLKEGMENVWKRHEEMAKFVQGWAKDRFELFAEPGYESNTLTTVANTRDIKVADVIKAVQEKHNTIFSNGYGDLKEKTFRIAHMGDICMDDLKELLGWIDDEIG